MARHELESVFAWWCVSAHSPELTQSGSLPRIRRVERAVLTCSGHQPTDQVSEPVRDKLVEASSHVERNAYECNDTAVAAATNSTPLLASTVTPFQNLALRKDGLSQCEARSHRASNAACHKMRVRLAKEL